MRIISLCLFAVIMPVIASAQVTILTPLLHISSFGGLKASCNKPPFSNFIDIDPFETLEYELREMNQIVFGK